MNIPSIEWDNVPLDNVHSATSQTEAHVGHQAQTHSQADWQGPIQQDTYARGPFQVFQEQPGLLAESQSHYFEYCSGWALSGHGQLNNAAQAVMAGLGQINRPDQARRPGSGRTVDQHDEVLQQIAQIYDETPQGQGCLPPNSVAATHSGHYMMQPWSNPQQTSYQKTEFMQPNRDLHQPRDAGNLDVATSSQGQTFTQPTSSDLEDTCSGSASEHRHLRKSDASHAGSQPSATPSQAKRKQNKRRRRQTPESPDSEGSGSTIDSSCDGEWGGSARNKKRQRQESKPSTSKASTIKQSKKRDVKRTSNVDTNGNAVHSAVFGVYELAGEQGYCERNQAPEIYRRNNMRALQCHYTLTSTSTTSDGLLFVGDPATGKRHLVTSMTFRISGVTSENEREDLPILESDNKRSKWTPTGPKRNVLPHIPPMSDGTVANGAKRFHKSVGMGNDVPKSTHYEWSHLQFQAGTKHNGVRRTTQMFQFMRLSLIAEWGKGEHDRTKVASCAGQRYIVFARSPGGRKPLIKDEKEESEATKRQSQSKQPQGCMAFPGPEIESGTAQRKHNRRGPKAGKRKRRRRDDTTPPPTPKAEPESDSEPLIGRMRRKAAQAGRTPRDILHLPPSSQEQEPIAASSLNEEDQQPRRPEEQRAHTPPAQVSRGLADQELGLVSVPFYSPINYGKGSDFGSPVKSASIEPGSQLESHFAVADESKACTLMAGPTPYGTMDDTLSSYLDEDGSWGSLGGETEDIMEVKEDPDEKDNVEKEWPSATAEMHEAEPNVLAGMGGSLEDESQVLRTSIIDASRALMSPSATHHVPTIPDNPGLLNSIEEASAAAYYRQQLMAYDWEQPRPPQTIDPNMLELQYETAGVDYDPDCGFDKDDFWRHQM